MPNTYMFDKKNNGEYELKFLTKVHCTRNIKNIKTTQIPEQIYDWTYMCRYSMMYWYKKHDENLCMIHTWLKMSVYSLWKL